MLRLSKLTDYAVAVLVTAPGASARADDGEPGEPVVFEVYEMLCRSAALHDEAERQGVGLIPLITEWRFFDHERGRPVDEHEIARTIRERRLHGIRDFLG